MDAFVLLCTASSPSHVSDPPPTRSLCLSVTIWPQGHLQGPTMPCQLLTPFSPPRLLTVGLLTIYALMEAD